MEAARLGDMRLLLPTDEVKSEAKRILPQIGGGRGWETATGRPSDEVTPGAHDRDLREFSEIVLHPTAKLQNQ